MCPRFSELVLISDVLSWCLLCGQWILRVSRTWQDCISPSAQPAAARTVCPEKNMWNPSVHQRHYLPSVTAEAPCLPHTRLSPSPALPPSLHLKLSVPWLGPLPKKDLSSEPCEACLSLFFHWNQLSLRRYFIDGSLKWGLFSCHGGEVAIWGVVAAATPFPFSQKPFLKSSPFLVNLLADLGVPKTLVALSWSVCWLPSLNLSRPLLPLGPPRLVVHFVLLTCPATGCPTPQF